MLRDQAIALRKQGKTYAEICSVLGTHIPKSTLSYWLRHIELSSSERERIRQLSLVRLEQSRMASLETKRRIRVERESRIHERNLHLYELMQTDRYAQKIALAMLYLGEGSKSDRSSLMFGNSNPDTVRLFLRLLRNTFDVDETRLRATVQCRADQCHEQLMVFWADIASIPLSQFYKPQIDPRTQNKPTKRSDYRGVCRIDYFSSEVDLELKCIAQRIQTVHNI